MRAGEFLASLQDLPLVDIATLLRGRRALILAPHPDDESLGAGGLIAAACAAGLPPLVVILTDGAASHPGSSAYPPARLRAVRRAEALQALAILGLPAEAVTFLDHPDTALPAAGTAFEATARHLSELAKTHACRLIIGPWAGDPHCDHVAAAALAAAVAKSRVAPLLSYPVWGWLRDADDEIEDPRTGGHRLDITAHATQKQQAIAAHKSQYGALIEDCPSGFILPPALLNIFRRTYEVFIS